MLSSDQISNLISYVNDRVDFIRKYGEKRDMDLFQYEFKHFIDCLGCRPVIEEGHLVDLEEI